MQYSRSLYYALLFILISIFFSTALFSQSFSVVGISDLIVAFPDGYNLPEKKQELSLFGIRGEIISGQLVVHADQNLKDVFVTVSDLTDNSSEKMIPSDIIELNFVGSILLNENAPNQPQDVLTRKAPALFPDYLMAEKRLDLKKDQFQAVWLTISIPESVSFGTYSGEITVTSAGVEQMIPLKLTIYPFQMPVVRHLKITEWYSTRHFEKFHGISDPYSDEWFAMLGIYADNMVKHRQNIFQVPMNSIRIERRADGSLNFDFSRFDQIADVFWNTGKMDNLETGELARFGEKAWFDTEIRWKDFAAFDLDKEEEISLPGEVVIPLLLPAFEDHLRSKGWLHRTLFHVKDEPTLRNVPAWKEKSSIIHQYAPDLVRIDAIESTFLFDEIEIAVPKLDHLAGWFDVYSQAALHGIEMWFYTVGIYQGPRFPNKTIDMPLMDSRILHWLNYRFDLAGYLHWGWNQWTENPFQETGMHIGDGWHVYPARNGVLNSLRWEQMRNGIQDYEYLWMLEDRIRNLKDSLGSRFHWIDPKQRSKEIAGRVVKSFVERTGDPHVLYEAKEAVIKEMIEMSQSPGVYVQTNPPVNASPVMDQSLVEVFGWAEPGASVEINGEKLVTDNKGMFLQNLRISREENRVVIDIRKDNRHKRIVRQFSVK